MKRTLSFVLLVALLPAFAHFAGGQEKEDEVNLASSSVDDLRMHLAEVQAREGELQARAKQIDEDLKPENIARSLAGVGSTKPEEMRELRRRELTIEREKIANQLKLYAKSRERLQTVIQTAENRAYQQSADGVLNHFAATPNARVIGLLVIAMLTILAGVVGLVVARRRALF
jgi:chromosome segregation ATPase